MLIFKKMKCFLLKNLKNFNKSLPQKKKVVKKILCYDVALLILLPITGCLTPKIDLGFGKKSEPTEITYTQQKLDVQKDEPKIYDCKLERTNEYIDGEKVIFTKTEYIKLVRNINAMRACYNNMREKYLLEIDHYNNLIDIINGDYKEKKLV